MKTTALIKKGFAYKGSSSRAIAGAALLTYCTVIALYTSGMHTGLEFVRAEVRFIYVLGGVIAGAYLYGSKLAYLVLCIVDGFLLLALMISVGYGLHDINLLDAINLLLATFLVSAAICAGMEVQQVRR